MAADNRSDLYPCFVRYCSVHCWISLNMQATMFSAWLVHMYTSSYPGSGVSSAQVWGSQLWKSVVCAIKPIEFLIRKSAVLISSYSNITSTKSPSFCVVTFNASLTHITSLPPQSHHCSCYVSRRTLAPPPIWLRQHTDLRAHEFAHSPDVWLRPKLTNVSWTWSWRLCGFNPDIPTPQSFPLIRPWNFTVLMGHLNSQIQRISKLWIMHHLANGMNCNVD
jgi:hypothetical protein